MEVRVCVSFVEYLEILLKTLEKAPESVKKQTFQQVSEIFKNFWKSLEVFRNLWKSLEISGSLWKSSEKSENVAKR